MTAKPFTLKDIQLIEQKAQLEARERLWAYRQYMNHNLLLGWWQRDLCLAMMRFVDDLAAGLRPTLIVSAPPQHGKSVTVLDAIAWIIGHNPHLKVVFGSYSEMLGIRANLYLQRAIQSPKYKAVFPELKLPTPKDLAIRTRDKFEFLGQEGSFRNTTVGGAITGEPLDLCVLDDVIKGRAEANSQIIRDRAWDWFTDDVYTRFSKHAGMIWIGTRWHEDDPIGRFIKAAKPGENIAILTYEAIATQDGDKRKEGEALFPEHKPIDFLLERKSKMASFNWLALYQQAPQNIKGGLIKASYFGRYKVLPPLKWRGIYVDTAQKTKESSDYSVFEVWGLGQDGKIYLIDLLRKKVDAVDLERQAIDFWSKHLSFSTGHEVGALRKMAIEDAVSGTGLIQRIKRNNKIPVRAVVRVKDKFTRLSDVLGYIESGYVMLPETAPWVADFIDECERFTADDTHDYDDQVDPMVDAINDMLAAPAGQIKSAKRNNARPNNLL